MQDSLTSNADDEIDLRELFISLWAYKLVIAGTCALGIVFAGYIALSADKKFTSTAIFKLDQAKSQGISLGGDLGKLASLAGFGGGGGAALSLPLDMIKGRIFIEKLETRLNFQTDPYLNKYNPNSIDPISLSELKWEVVKTKEGTIQVVVTHVNAQRASEIANVIMDEIISSAKNKKNTEQDEQLSYLSNTLAKALSDLEVSQSNLKEFALENNSLPLESFAVESLQLDALREKLSRTSELQEAVAALSLMLRNKTTDQKNYLSLRQQFPIVDQVEFRRVLGQNEIISFWSWPEVSSVAAVFATLSERKSRLQSQINVSQIDAERLGRAVETYAKLEREAKVAQATYAVLIEQVKAQSMVAGYRPDRSEIYEYAFPSISPSAPKRNEILALGAVLGLFVGAVLSLVLGRLRGVYYSKKSLITGAGARLTSSVRALMPLHNKSLNDVNTTLMKKPLSVLRDMAVEVHKSGATQVVVTSSRAKITGNDVARALASYMQSDTMKVAVIDFSSRGKKLDFDAERLSVGSFVVAESTGHVVVLRPDGDLAAMELLSQRDFWKNAQSLNSTFDLVFLCADNGDAISLLSALEGQKTFHITLARTNHTKSATLAHMRSLLPIQGLLYD